MQSVYTTKLSLTSRKQAIDLNGSTACFISMVPIEIIKSAPHYFMRLNVIEIFWLFSVKF